MCVQGWARANTCVCVYVYVQRVYEGACVCACGFWAAHMNVDAVYLQVQANLQTVLHAQAKDVRECRS